MDHSTGRSPARRPPATPRGRTTVSIPSKYEQATPARNRTPNAFTTSVKRFRPYTTYQPGPGMYHHASTLERDAKTCGSVSYKGSMTRVAAQLLEVTAPRRAPRGGLARRGDGRSRTLSRARRGHAST